MMIQVEKGKKYRARDGRGPAVVVSVIDGIAHVRYPDDRLCGVWKDSGRADLSREYPFDLVAEWTDEPATPVTKRDVLEKAIAAVADRGLNYGKPEDNFARIANLWNAHLENRGILPPNVASAITAGDVAAMMALMKIARLENDPSHLDSWVDLAGYAACGAEISVKGA